MGAFFQIAFISHSRTGDAILKTLAEDEAERKTTAKLKRWANRRWEYICKHSVWSKVAAALITAAILAFIGWIVRIALR